MANFSGGDKIARPHFSSMSVGVHIGIEFCIQEAVKEVYASSSPKF